MICFGLLYFYKVTLYNKNNVRSCFHIRIVNRSSVMLAFVRLRPERNASCIDKFLAAIVDGKAININAIGVAAGNKINCMRSRLE